MNGWEQRFVWDFPFGVMGLAVALSFALCWIAAGYLFTLRKLRLPVRIVLTAIRFAVVILLLICLSNPRMERKSIVGGVHKQRLAAVFDRSGSMFIPGFWKERRVDEQLRLWKDKVRHSPENFETGFFVFDEKFRRVSSPEAEMETKDGAQRQTRLFENVAHWCRTLEEQGFDAVLCFTDGIDTSTLGIEHALRALASSRLRHIMVPLVTELPLKPLALIKAVETPTKVAVGGEVGVSVIVQYSGIPAEKRMELRLCDASGKELALRKIDKHFASGNSLSQFSLPASEPGTDYYSLSLLLDGKVESAVTWSLSKVRVNRKKRILLYQGALDWGTRFLKYAFATGDYDFEARFAPSVLKRDFKGDDNDFPVGDNLAGYDAVLLLNLNRAQISGRMETELRKYVDGGGGVMFITGNPLAAREYAGSELEKLLPVTFADHCNVMERGDRVTRLFLERMKRSPRSAGKSEDGFVRMKETAFSPPPLMDFELTQSGGMSALFRRDGGEGTVIPRFQDLAYVKEAKPGAEVLAVHRDKTGKEHILLAFQQFGFGRSAVMATDPLWRWRLASPSSDRSYEQFWRNLAAWLSSGRERMTRWELNSMIVPNGKPFDVNLISELNPDTPEMKVYLEDGKGGRRDLRLLPTSEREKYRCSITLDPEDSRCRLVAEEIRRDGSRQLLAEASFSQARPMGNLEELLLKPDMASLERMATLPNVELAKTGEVIDLDGWLGKRGFEQSRGEVRHLWHHEWMLALILALLCLEHVVRRCFKLV